MTKIYSKVEPDKLLHFIHKLDDSTDNRTDLVEPDNFIQCSFLKLEKDKTFVPHIHIEKERHYEKQIAQKQNIVKMRLFVFSAFGGRTSGGRPSKAQSGGKPPQRIVASTEKHFCSTQLALSALQTVRVPQADCEEDARRNTNPWLSSLLSLVLAVAQYKYPGDRNCAP